MAGTISMAAMARPIDQSGGQDCAVSLFVAQESKALFMNVEEDEFKWDRDVITGIVFQGL
jgi:hypothetical protein